MLFQSVPNKMKTVSVYKITVQNNGNVLEFVPKKLKEQLKQYVKSENMDLPKEKYQQVFDKIRSFFPESSLSLTI